LFLGSKLTEKTQIKSMADHVRFNPFLRLWLPDYIVHKFIQNQVCFSQAILDCNLFLFVFWLRINNEVRGARPVVLL